MENRVQTFFDEQKQKAAALRFSTARQRIQKLRTLEKTVLAHRTAIQEALHADMGKPPVESDLADIFPTLSELRYTRKRLKNWMHPTWLPTPITYQLGKTWEQYEPKGRCLIISPWNFPINLTLVPLCSAVAAGNTAILKPSEFTPHANEVLKKIISQVFTPDEVVLVEGGATGSTQLLALPFDHIFFTGSPAIGKVVMEAASKNLSSVTLELGGKNAAIVDHTANISLTAGRIGFVKFYNAGQACIAPDYILVHKSKEAELKEALKREILRNWHTDNPLAKTYSQIISDRHVKRIKALLDEAVAAGAIVELGGDIDALDRRISPTLLSNVGLDCKLMEEEIFGPLLPMATYETEEELWQIIAKNHPPLTVHIFTSSQRMIEKVRLHTRSGSILINQLAVQYYHPVMGFGGLGASGFGTTHGLHGFKEFSHRRTFFKQYRFGAIDLLKPALTHKYTKWVVELLIRYF